MAEPSFRRSHIHKGFDYHEMFVSCPHRAMIWSLERDLLQRLVFDLFPGDSPRYLDFACGTGRILSHLAPLTASSVGVDVSASMLQVAQSIASGSELIRADITRDDQLGVRKFELITAFRFFPNAEPQLRREALRALRDHLGEGGVIIFNNHKNSSSLMLCVARAIKAVRALRSSGVRHEVFRARVVSPERVMSHTEVEELAAEAGLFVERQYHFGVLPVTDRHMLLPPAWIRGVESALSRVAVLAPLAQSVIYVCRRGR